MLALPKILLVEDDRYIASTLVQTLSSTYQVDVALSGKSGLYKTDSEVYDIVILDLNLPDISGQDVCQQLRHRGIKAPILILSGNVKVISKINLLDAGANDYLTKPFSLGELKARLKALLRSKQAPVWPAMHLEVSGITLNRRNYSVSRNGVELQLRRKEFELLECLMEQAGNVVSRQDLIDRVWQGFYDSITNTLDVHIKYLRDKLDRPFDKPLIATVHGRGYMLRIAGSSQPKLVRMATKP
jgi:DNA-binding response OmpR family regulator